MSEAGRGVNRMGVGRVSEAGGGVNKREGRSSSAQMLIDMHNYTASTANYSLFKSNDNQ